MRLALVAVVAELGGARALQFSPDPALPREGLAGFELSTFGGENHLDMERVDRPNGAYDLVMASHVLEHVEDDLAALRELDRLSAPCGVVVLAVPDLLRVGATTEYGRARADKHGHWRVYGPDIVTRWRAAAPLWRGLGVVARDPVTGEADRLTLLSRSSARLEGLAVRLSTAGFAPFDAFAPPRLL
ncbi:class I SAM-dependent methyltransferase [Acuticoccus sp.]|uniref:class I SAM-dependent methyltransferase n=1 Tax=Acuticoccus sp. TaxID=1904378 RepID=UPI003B517D89